MKWKRANSRRGNRTEPERAACRKLETDSADYLQCVVVIIGQGKLELFNVSRECK